MKLLERLLKNEPDCRNLNTIEKIMKLTKFINFFKEISEKYNEKIHLHCCKYMRKRALSKGETLFNQGLQNFNNK